MPGRRIPTVYLSFVVVALAIGAAACASEPPRQADRPPALRSGLSGPAPGTLPPNASRIIAIVRGRTVWPPGSLAGARPAVRPDRTLYSLTLEVVTSAPAAPTVENLARPGSVIEAFSSEPPAADMIGTTVSALVELTGTTEGTRWMVSEIMPRP